MPLSLSPVSTDATRLSTWAEPATEPENQPTPVNTPVSQHQPLEPFYHPQILALQQPTKTASANSVSFDAQVRGQQSRPIDMQLAEICQNVYNNDGSAPDGWNRLDASQLSAAGIQPSALEDPNSGFRAGVYTDGDGHYVLAFAGTREGKDWLTDLEQGLGLSTAQYREAATLARQVKTAYGDDLVITGHSLGGGLAATAAAETDTAAVTFNAAGVHDDTLRSLGLDPGAVKADADAGQIRAYSVDGEILSALQDHRGAVLGALAAGGSLISPLLGGVAIGALLNGDLPPALGHRVTLGDPAPVEKPDLHWYDWLWGDAEVREGQYLYNEVKHSISEHSMSTVLDAMHKDHPDW